MQHSKHHQGHASPLTMMTRRGAMKVSVATALGATLGPTLPSAFAAGKPSTNEKSVILLWLEGGPFQHESFDPKEHRQADKMGIQYKAIQTAVPGYRFASCLQQLTKIGGRITSIRSMVGSEMEHTLAQYHAQTGWRNTGSIQAPALGSIVSHELGSVRMKRAKPTGLPGYVSIGRDGYSSGYFGPEHKPTVVWDPNSPPENLGLPRGVSPAVFDRRLQLLQNVESARSDVVARQIRNGRESAVRFMRSKERVAFDLSKESDKTRDAYGRCRFGQGCLLARRLVESGVRFVQVTSENFDQHDKHYPRQIDLFEQLDHGMARLRH